MRSTRKIVAVGLGLAALFATSACGGRGGDASAANPGISDTEVVVGSSYPYSGPASAFGTVGKAVEAYFDYVNEEHGGVEMADGKTRKIKFISYDDAYAPEKQLANARKLIEKDQVFALFNMLGTPTHLAAVDYINQQEIPDIFLNSVSAIWSKDPAKWPWTTGWLPGGEVEGPIYAEHLKQTNPDAKVAILSQHDDAGEALRDSFKAALEGSDIEVVGDLTYEVAEPTVDSQVVKLASSGADVFIIGATPKAATQALRKAQDIGWDATKYLWSPSGSIKSVLEPAGVAATKGVISSEYLKSASDPALADDPAIVEFKKVLSEYGNGLDPNDRLNANGVAAAQTLVGTLERLEEPTREALNELVRNLDPGVEVPMFLPGLDVQTSAESIMPVKGMQLQVFDGTSWRLEGDPIFPELEFQ
jgi:branched-chain amino acid transport system substrate-binding protein